MKKLLIPLCVAAAAGLAACQHVPDSSFAAGRIAPQPVAYYPGSGVVDRVEPSPSYAAAGGSASSSRLNRVYVRMDDGRLQFVDTESTELSRGMRVELQSDRQIRIIP